MTQTAQTREALKEVMLTAMSEFHSGNFAEAQRIVDAQIAALEAAGVRLVPVELTEDMGAEMECQFSTDGQWEAALAASPYKAKEPTND